jgi:hypothetical protein
LPRAQAEHERDWSGRHRELQREAHLQAHLHEGKTVSAQRVAAEAVECADEVVRSANARVAEMQRLLALTQAEARAIVAAHTHVAAAVQQQAVQAALVQARADAAEQLDGMRQRGTRGMTWRRKRRRVHAAYRAWRDQVLQRGLVDRAAATVARRAVQLCGRRWFGAWVAVARRRRAMWSEVLRSTAVGRAQSAYKYPTNAAFLFWTFY